ncbi:related to cytosolic Cu/Zn superoxide dismutase [Phialocephala subalpina]|uniref:superoxide dismutase n=1 Tax=Phialocephala subalpina TaxID=576137 RepID=A0A1L7WDK3_9HELO|nr:related to cytosolic Cu/Zn superoxide dismutase [Phialocephala subalpina]
MYLFSILAVFLTVFSSLVTAQTTTEPITGIRGNASIVENNPPGVVYTATLPTTEFNNPTDPRGNIKGSVSAVAASNGIGVDFKVSFENLPTGGGPFLYHIHAAPVSADGNCTNTLGHLDPYIRGETPACNATLPQTCQVGDLSGKHGKIEADPFVATYHDDFASTVSGIGAFFGNRSITVHFANTTRITCANFTLSAGNVTIGGGSGSNASASATSTAPVTQTSAPLQFTGIGAGSSNAISLIMLLGAMGVAFLL